MYELGWFIELLRWGLLLGAAAYFVRKLRSRRQGTDPACAACEYSLIGLPDTSDRCPECGALLRTPGAIQRGHVQSIRIPLRALAGVIAIFFALGWVGGRIHAYTIEHHRRPMALFQAVMNSDLAEVQRLLKDEPALLKRVSSSPPLGVLAVLGDDAHILAELGKHEDLTAIVVEGDYSGFGASYGSAARTSSLLHLAAGAEATNTLALLLDSGKFAVNARDASGRTPLHYAAGIYNRGAAMTFVLARPGVDLNAADVDGVTPLIRAISNGRSAIASQLIQAGADIQLCSNDKRSPLHWAVRDADGTLVLELLSRGADLLAKDAEGKTPLAMESRVPEFRISSARRWLEQVKKDKGRDAVRELLAKEPMFARMTLRGSTLLHNFADPEMLTDLVAAGADVNAVNESGDTPLLSMLASGHTPAALALLDAGADIEIANKERQTPLMLSAKGFVETKLFEAILRKGADVRKKDTYGSTVMHYACVGHLPVRFVNTLLDKGCPLDAAAAIRLSKTEELRRLLRETPDAISASDNAEGYTLLHYAIVSKNREALELLISAGASVNAVSKGQHPQTPLYLSLSHANPDFASMLVAAGADVRQQPEPTLGSALHMATWQKERAIMELLIQRGADVNAANARGERPLHHAAAVRYGEGVKVLLQHGATIDAKDRDGRTPLDTVSRFNSPEAKATAALLQPRQ